MLQICVRTRAFTGRVLGRWTNFWSEKIIPAKRGCCGERKKKNVGISFPIIGMSVPWMQARRGFAGVIKTESSAIPELFSIIWNFIKSLFFSALFRDF